MISLLHPSRGRPSKSFLTSKEWIDRAGCPTELILSIDPDDKTYAEYLKRYQYWINAPKQRITIEDKPHDSVVHATNMAARHARGDILIYLSDDFRCFDNWGLAVIKEFKKYTGPTLIKVDDCLQPFHVAVLTIPMMTRSLYEKLGYFWHPGYRSMFCDEHLYWRCQRLGVLRFADHLKFEHAHACVGKCEDDETYRRSAANWDQGKNLFAIHRKAEFTV